MHIAVVVKKLGVWFGANFCFADHVHNICKTSFIQMYDLIQGRQYQRDEAAILLANALVSSHLDHCNSLFRSQSSFNMCKLQFTQNTSLFTVVIRVTLVLFCLLVVKDIIQDSTAQIKGSWWFINSIYLCLNHKDHSFAFVAPMLWNNLPDEVGSAPTITSFKKKLKSYLFKEAFPT